MNVNPAPKKYRLRVAARGIVFEGDFIAMMKISSHKLHKLPGGGVEKGETIANALKREIKEETGCTIGRSQRLGTIIEFRNKQGLKQISHCFITRVTKKGPTQFTKSECHQGFRLQWVPLKKAISMLKKDMPHDYTSLFVQRRDLIFLHEALKSLALTSRFKTRQQHSSLL